MDSQPSLFGLPGDGPLAMIRWGRFASASLEREYRESALPRERRLLARITVAAIVLVLAFIANDLRFFGAQGPFWLTLAARLAFAVGALATLRALGAPQTPGSIDRHTRRLAILLFAAFAIIVLTRPPGFWAITVNGFAIAMATYAVPLMPLPVQALYAGTLSLLTISHAVLTTSPASDLTTLGTMTVGLHVLGYPVAALQHIGPRRAFLALARERALRGFLEQLVNTSPSLISVVDARGSVLFANEAVASAAAAAGPPGGRTTAAFPPLGSEDLAQVIAKHARIERDEAVRTSDGTLRWYHTVRVPLDRTDGTVQVLSISADITARKREEEMRQHLESQVQHAQRLESLGVLAGGIAHDFNNLLTAIVGNAELLVLAAPADPQIRESVDAIRTAGVRAAELTQQMLAYAGRGPLRRRHVDLATVVDEMAALLRSIIAKKTICRPDLGHAWVLGDAAQLRQVVVNLITNASEALDGETGEVTLCTGIRDVTSSELAACVVNADLAPGPCAFIEVSDTGHGMSAETVQRIFDPFFTTKFTGRGLGLSAVLGIVRHHGGALRVLSQPGKGSTFTVWFPLATAPQPDLPAPARPRGAPVRGSVLVVDDEPQVRTLLERTLGAAGFSVFTAEDGEQGLAAIAEQPGLDLVLLDVTMPRMDGWDVLAELRANRPDLPVVMMSGYSRLEPPSPIGAEGTPPFVAKPFDADQLVRTLEETLAARASTPGGPGTDAR